MFDHLSYTVVDFMYGRLTHKGRGRHDLVGRVHMCFLHRSQGNTPYPFLTLSIGEFTMKIYDDQANGAELA